MESIEVMSVCPYPMTDGSKELPLYKWTAIRPGLHRTVQLIPAVLVSIWFSISLGRHCPGLDDKWYGHPTSRIPVLGRRSVISSDHRLLELEGILESSSISCLLTDEAVEGLGTRKIAHGQAFRGRASPEARSPSVWNNPNLPFPGATARAFQEGCKSPLLH